MIKRNAIKLLIICCLISGSGLAETPVNYTSTEVYDFSKKISEAVREEIWPGFEPLKYTSLKTDTEKSFINFAADNFSWNLFDDYFQNHSLEENLGITFHEAFHAFQRDAGRAGQKWGAENSMLVFEYQESSARNNALFNIEAKILRAALQSKNAKELKARSSEFLAVRRLRQSELEPRFAEFEKGAELNEGLAEYAGTQAVAAAMQAVRQKKISIPFENTESRTFLLKKYERLDSITKIGRNIRLKFYYTGSAQGFLLDRLLKDWKTKVQMHGRAVQDLLAESLGKSIQSNDVENILSRHEYEKILVEEVKAVAKRKAENQALLDKTLNEKGRKYTIDYSGLNRPAGIKSFDPMNVTMISPKIRVHTRSVTFAGQDAFTAQFSQPVVEDLENKQYVTIVPESGDAAIIVDGSDIDLTRAGEIKFNKISINSENFKLEAISGMVKITKDGIMVKILE